MPESVASLKRENSKLKDQLSVMADEIAKMKEMLLEQSKKPAATNDEVEQSLEFMSKEYDDFERFRVSAGKELDRLGAMLDEIAVEVNRVSRSIDEFQEYSYQYNVKIVGVPQLSQDESSASTSELCDCLFKAIGSAVSIHDIDTAHRVPTRSNDNGGPRPIICRFIRRLSKDDVMNHKRNASKVAPSAVGLPDGASLSAVRIFDHLTPRMQKVLFEAKRFKEQFHYQYCWSKGSLVYLRKDTTSRAIKIKDITDLHRLTNGQIGHSQVGMTTDHEWIPCTGSTSGNGLKKYELGTIPFVNKRVSVVRPSRVVAGKSEECMTIDVNRLHAKCPMTDFVEWVLLSWKFATVRYFSPFNVKNLKCEAPFVGNFWNTENRCPFHWKITESSWYVPS
ncbi:hypothetical protein AWC38_SpisGene22222 [Stylophora pistillata]|uniref:FP protein C-terminal domain-containing protein n=1 Tax=Stylophora pistillata TaxID=50429 RepID=A0A2B4RBK7_STYPI|nr:hypothetical protein AWC38_SpisGene22222 [Stylophora pistillata]